MRVEVKVPSAGESVAEGDIARWLKQDGDYVELDEPLCELETDKASLEITAEKAGKLSIDVEEGETVEVGQVIGYIETDAEAPADDNDESDESDDKSDESEAAAPPPPEKETVAEALAKKAEADDEEDDDAPSMTSTVNLVLPSPAARKIMAENDISAKDVTGTGKDGRITKGDVISYLDKVEHDKKTRITEKQAETPRKEAISKPSPEAARPAAPKAKPGERNVRREKMSRIRKTIAQRLVKTTQELAMLTTFNEVDMSAIKEIRGKYKESFKEKHEVNLGFMSFFTRAVCIALREYPAANAQIEGEEIVYHDYCDIGIAVSTPRGLVVPNIRNAETLNFNEIESAIVDLAIRGRDGKLSIDELTDGTFTITNGGIFGSMLSTPLVNYPQSAILGMHNIVDRPVAVNGEVVIRPIMYVALSYDHRIIDGKEAVSFLHRLKGLLEDPVRLMLNV